MKNCTQCRRDLPLSEFSMRSASPDGLSYMCRGCAAQRGKQYRAARREAEAERRKDYRIRNSDYVSSYKRAWQDANREAYNAYMRRYRRTDKARSARGQYERSRASTDHRFRLDRNLSRQIRLSLAGSKQGRSWETLVGYSLDELMREIESKFQPGMGWENYGDWHIDHVYCKALFRYQSAGDVEFRLCWALRNLTPMWGRENRAKSDYLPDGRRARELADDERCSLVAAARVELWGDGAPQ